jgi:glutamate racemase
MNSLNNIRSTKISPADAIGVFDSGVGGLTVLSEIRRVLPGENILYFGDTARVPYGPKSKDVICRYTKEIVAWLLSCNVKMIVIACNTSTAVMGQILKEELDIPVIGVIEPACRLASSITVNGKIGVIGTRGTVKSGAYQKRLLEINNNFTIYQESCPLFVPMAEEGWTQGVVPKEVARNYLAPLQRENVDTLILGCTHYPILREVIAETMGKNVNIIDSATQTALTVKITLEENGLLSSASEGECRFACSDSPELFQETGNRFLNFAIPSVDRVKVWEFCKE